MCHKDDLPTHIVKQTLTFEFLFWAQPKMIILLWQLQVILLSTAAGGTKMPKSKAIGNLMSFLAYAKQYKNLNWSRVRKTRIVMMRSPHSFMKHFLMWVFLNLGEDFFHLHQIWWKPPPRMLWRRVQTTKPAALYLLCSFSRPYKRYLINIQATPYIQIIITPKHENPVTPPPSKFATAYIQPHSKKFKVMINSTFRVYTIPCIP